MISVSLTALPGPLRQVLTRGLESVARDPDAEPGQRIERPFDAVQLDARNQTRTEELGETARREVRRRLSERNLTVSGLLFPLRGSVADEDRLDARIAAVQAAMDLAFDLGARSLVLPAARLPEESSPAEARLADVLDLLARHGDRTGVTLTLRLGSDAERWSKWLAEAARDAPLAVQFDPASAIISGQNVENTLRAVSELVTQIRLRDAVSESSASGREVQIGRGEVDFDLLAGLSTELSRPPVIVIDPSEATPAALRTAVSFARAVFQQR